MLRVAARPLGRTTSRSTRVKRRPRNRSRSRTRVNFTRPSLLFLRGAPLEKVLEERRDFPVLVRRDRGARLAGHLAHDRGPAARRDVRAEGLVEGVALGAAALGERE